jgi:N-acetyl-alpha-D-muramate 1-phosphate uridylyltransferase
MQAVILAGGLATRMRPRTLGVAKFLLPVAGRPFASWLLERLRTSGFSEVVLCIGHLGDQIRAFVGDGRAFGLSVRYEDEGQNLLGTAGAIRNAAAHLAPQFLVTYGDSYLPFDYSGPMRALLAHDDADGVMAVYRNVGRWDASNTRIRRDDAGDLWVARYQKGSGDPSLDHIDYGATALRREVIERLAEGAVCGLDRIQAELSASGRLRACMARERFFEIGTEQGLSDLERALSKEPDRK